MVTPAFVLNDQAAVRRIARQIRNSDKANVLCGLVDLQVGSVSPSGAPEHSLQISHIPVEYRAEVQALEDLGMQLIRDYIFPGRNATDLAPKTVQNLRIVLDEGVCPLIIIRNDWASRTQTGVIPSVGTKIPNDQFYSATRLQTEREFIRSLAWLFPYASFQLQLEPSSTHSAAFAVGLAQEFRAAGYTGPLYINPFDTSVPGHEQRRQQFADLGVIWARSHHGTSPVDPVWNTDGNRQISSANADEWVGRLERSGRPWILWSADLANTQHSIPAPYLS